MPRGMADAASAEPPHCSSEHFLPGSTLCWVREEPLSLSSALFMVSSADKPTTVSIVILQLTCRYPQSPSSAWVKSLALRSRGEVLAACYQNSALRGSGLAVLPTSACMDINNNAPIAIDKSKAELVMYEYWQLVASHEISLSVSVDL